MTKDAIAYALSHVPVPQGKLLWLYGDAHVTSGDVYSPFHDSVQQLQKKGLTVSCDFAAIPADYDAIMIHAPKQQEETEGLLALALTRTKGFVMAIAANDAGGNRLTGLFKSYGLETRQLSKEHCKIVWTTEAGKARKAEVTRNLALLEPHTLTMGGRQWWTVPGLFGWNKIDPGSALLTAHLPADLAGRAADFGCGFGYLCAFLADHNPGIVSIDAYDLDARAIAATARNAGKTTAIWQDMRSFAPKPVYDVIVMNPPFHSGRQEDIGLGERFICTAWEALRSGGRLFMVANRNLPYERIVPQLKVVHTGQGYKIMTGRKP